MDYLSSENKGFNLILNEIKSLKSNLPLNNTTVLILGDWIPRKQVLKFFDYGDTQLRQLEKTKAIIYSKIGNRKFYSVDSIIQIIENHKIQ